MPTWITECLGVWLVLTIVSVSVGATMGFFDGMVDIADERKALKAKEERAKEELERQLAEALYRRRMREVARDLHSRGVITLSEYYAFCNDITPIKRYRHGDE